jgi:hypothetical protein
VRELFFFASLFAAAASFLIAEEILGSLTDDPCTPVSRVLLDKIQFSRVIGKSGSVTYTCICIVTVRTLISTVSAMLHRSNYCTYKSSNRCQVEGHEFNRL